LANEAVASMDPSQLTQDIVRRILSFHERKTILSVDGMLCAGKTTLVNSITAALNKRQLDVVRFSSDMFLLDRNKRDYFLNTKLQDLAEWFSPKEGIGVLSHLVQSSKQCRVNFMGYDRSTGTRSLDVSLEYDPTSSILLLEGLYITKWMLMLHANPTMKVFLTLSQDVSYERMVKRNTYIALSRLEYECSNIYFPAIASYCQFLRDRKIVFDVLADTSDLGTIKIQECTSL
jgi:uridine kinase